QSTRAVPRLSVVPLASGEIQVAVPTAQVILVMSLKPPTGAMICTPRTRTFPSRAVQISALIVRNATTLGRHAPHDAPLRCPPLSYSTARCTARFTALLTNLLLIH